MSDELSARRRQPLVPCGSTTMAVLGYAEPTRVWCYKLRGHEGMHEHFIKWTDEGALIEQDDGSLIDRYGHVWQDAKSAGATDG